MRVSAALALTALFPAAAWAQDCKSEFGTLQKQIEGATLQAEYEGRETTHPLVLQMASGEAVDLSGMIITARPYESWTGARPVVAIVTGYIESAQSLIEAGNEEECLAMLEEARGEIGRYEDERDALTSGEADSPE